MIARESDERLKDILLDQAISLDICKDAIARLHEYVRNERPYNRCSPEVHLPKQLLEMLVDLCLLSATWMYDSKPFLVGSIQERRAQLSAFTQAYGGLQIKYSNLQYNDPDVLVRYFPPSPDGVSRCAKIYHPRKSGLGQDRPG